MSVCSHGYEISGARGPCPECEAEQREQELHEEIAALKAAVAEFHSFLMSESYWEAADALVERFPWIRGTAEPREPACPECGEPALSHEGKRFCDCGWSEAAP